MAKKSMKEVANAGTSVFEQLTNNNISYGRGAEDTQDTESVKNTKAVQDVQDTQDAINAKNTTDAKSAKGAPKKKDKPHLERLNLKLPAEIKEYLTVAAAKQSIELKRPVSLTEYLCQLVRKDMEKDK